jgi:hypothetical protein
MLRCHRDTVLKEMLHRLLLLCTTFACTGCVNLYSRVDRTPDGQQEEQFAGIRKHLLAGTEFHVLQVHGMGDHEPKQDCAQDSSNVQLQHAIAAGLGLQLSPSHDDPAPKPIYVNEILAGTYTTRLYEGSIESQYRRLYFSCVTWGEASREIKRSMLELDGDFYEVNDNEAHRAWVNREAKRFVNEKFSDPLIYVGTFGPFIRRALLNGLTAAAASHQQRRRPLDPGSRSKAEVAATFLEDVRTAVISDSLGSRVVFDVLCAKQPVCAARTGLKALDLPADDARGEEMLAAKATLSMRSIYMLANQLPLLELASLPPPSKGVPLSDLLANGRCYHPLSSFAEQKDAAGPVEVVAFTDVNDALSYNLSERFKRRCAPDPSKLRIVNVTLPNAKIRWLFVYSHLPKAHSDGFKTNQRAVDFLVKGN